MSSNDFVSSTKQIPYPQETVYDKLQDLTHLEQLRQRLNTPDFEEKIASQIGADKAQDVKQRLQSMTFTSDSLSVPSPLGEMSLEIVEREAPKLVKFEGKGTPVAVHLWIQLLPSDEGRQSLMRVTLRAELNMFIRKMVESQYVGTDSLWQCGVAESQPSSHLLQVSSCSRDAQAMTYRMNIPAAMPTSPILR